MEKYPKVLVISHNSFSKTNNMGKTLASMLSWLPPESIAQIYFHHEIPTVDICHRYYRITDIDVLKSIVQRTRSGTRYGEQDIDRTREVGRNDRGISAKVYQAGRIRSPLIYWSRDFLWSVGSWWSKDLDQWIREFSPNLIFFASGDYSFAYKITETLARKYDLPVVLYCCDDFYMTKRDCNKWLGRINYKRRIRWLKKLSFRTKQIVVISDKMQSAYRLFFSQPISVIRIAAEKNPYIKKWNKRAGIVYIGGLGTGRLEPIIEVGKTLKNANLSDFSELEVYSGEQNPANIRKLNLDNGISFRGALSEKEVLQKIGSAKYVLIVESFDENAKDRTRYSLSTKIGESLQSGAVILAFGPSDISSMEYLFEHQAGVIIHEAMDLPEIISYLEMHSDERKALIERARLLAEQCHDKEENDKKMMGIFYAACRGSDEESEDTV